MVTILAKVPFRETGFYATCYLSLHSPVTAWDSLRVSRALSLSLSLPRVCSPPIARLCMQVGKQASCSLSDCSYEWQGTFDEIP